MFTMCVCMCYRVMMDLLDLLEQLDHLVHLVKLVPLDPKAIQVTKDHRYC